MGNILSSMEIKAKHILACEKREISLELAKQVTVANVNICVSWMLNVYKNNLYNKSI